ncbi:MAG: head completion/stabilization protein [Pseudomonadales bacterium]
MSGFIANGLPTEDSRITNNGFFPDVDPNQFREVMRVDSGITNARVRHALIDAIGKINIDLAAFKQLQSNLSIATLSDVPAPQVDGQSQHLHDYQRAVFCQAKAELNERYQDYDSSNNNSGRSDDIADSIDDYRRQSILAVRRIAGVSQSTIELI